MMPETDEAAVVARISRWAGEDARVRAALLTSSRVGAARARLDALSDYDVALLVADPTALYQDEAWLRPLGTPLLRVRDVEGKFGLQKPNVMVLFADGVKIDVSLWPLALAELVRERGALPEELDDGYRVLIDKDGITADWPAPSQRAFIPAKPTAAEFRALVEEFWWVATYVAKYLWRQEFIPAKVILDYELKYLILYRLLVWRAEIAHGWGVQPGFFGRGMARHLDPETWAEFRATYVGPDPAENWAALHRTIALYQRVARDVAGTLGHRYPHDLDESMIAYIRRIEGLGPDTEIG